MQSLQNRFHVSCKYRVEHYEESCLGSHEYLGNGMFSVEGGAKVLGFSHLGLMAGGTGARRDP